MRVIERKRKPETRWYGQCNHCFTKVTDVRTSETDKMAIAGSAGIIEYIPVLQCPRCYRVQLTNHIPLKRSGWFRKFWDGMLNTR